MRLKWKIGDRRILRNRFPSSLEKKFTFPSRMIRDRCVGVTRWQRKRTDLRSSKRIHFSLLFSSFPVSKRGKNLSHGSLVENGSLKRVGCLREERQVSNRVAEYKEYQRYRRVTNSQDGVAFRHSFHERMSILSRNSISNRYLVLESGRGNRFLRFEYRNGQACRRIVGSSSRR